MNNLISKIITHRAQQTQVGTKSLQYRMLLPLNIGVSRVVMLNTTCSMLIHQADLQASSSRLLDQHHQACLVLWRPGIHCLPHLCHLLGLSMACMLWQCNTLACSQVTQQLTLTLLCQQLPMACKAISSKLSPWLVSILPYMARRLQLGCQGMKPLWVLQLLLVHSSLSSSKMCQRTSGMDTLLWHSMMLMATGLKVL